MAWNEQTAPSTFTQKNVMMRPWREGENIAVLDLKAWSYGWLNWTYAVMFFENYLCCYVILAEFISQDLDMLSNNEQDADLEYRRL